MSKYNGTHDQHSPKRRFIDGRGSGYTRQSRGRGVDNPTKSTSVHGHFQSKVIQFDPGFLLKAVALAYSTGQCHREQQPSCHHVLV